MGRQPKAREVVLDAAEALVQAHGAASLTFEKLAEESGVTRGGITYHFPTKDDLLRALVARGLAHWQSTMAKLRPAACECAVLADTLAHIRTSCEKDEDQQRLVAGLVAAATHEPTLLDPVRRFHDARYAQRNWNDRELRMYVLELAAEGLFWQELFALHHLPAPARERLAELMEYLAQEWSGDAPAPHES